MPPMNNVSALIAADKAVHADMAENYKDGPYQDGMYGTGMLLELANLGFVVIRQKDWAEALEQQRAMARPGGMSDWEYEKLIEEARQGYGWSPLDVDRLKELVSRIKR